ncbi:MAG: hypothetical protein ABI675_02655 [Chitinophagaceae bacterium]
MLSKVDYTQTGFTLPIERDNVIGYASVNVEFYTEEEGLDFTGNYIVYLLHPSRGSMQFTLEPDVENKWVIDNDGTINPFPIEQDILDEISQAIELRRQSAGASAILSKN